LVELMRMSYEEWDVWTRGSAIRRAGYAGFGRNVAVALGNWLASVDEPPPDAVAALREALEDEEPLVREHAAWALGQVGSAEALAVLGDRLLVEEMEPVRDEIERALETGRLGRVVNKRTG
jgi:epoxyqueuosine reductase